MTAIALRATTEKEEVKKVKKVKIFWKLLHGINGWNIWYFNNIWKLINDSMKNELVVVKLLQFLYRRVFNDWNEVSAELKISISEVKNQ